MDFFFGGNITILGNWLVLNVMEYVFLRINLDHSILNILGFCKIPCFSCFCANRSKVQNSRFSKFSR